MICIIVTNAEIYVFLRSMSLNYDTGPAHILDNVPFGGTWFDSSTNPLNTTGESGYNDLIENMINTYESAYPVLWAHMRNNDGEHVPVVGAHGPDFDEQSPQSLQWSFEFSRGWTHLILVSRIVTNENFAGGGTFGSRISFSLTVAGLTMDFDSYVLRGAVGNEIETGIVTPYNDVQRIPIPLTLQQQQGPQSVDAIFQVKVEKEIIGNPNNNNFDYWDGLGSFVLLLQKEC